MDSTSTSTFSSFILNEANYRWLSLIVNFLAAFGTIAAVVLALYFSQKEKPRLKLQFETAIDPTYGKIVGTTLANIGKGSLSITGIYIKVLNSGLLYPIQFPDGRPILRETLCSPSFD